jgi:hypothetical protein
MKSNYKERPLPHILREYNEFDQFLADTKRCEAEIVFKEQEKDNCRYFATGTDPRYGLIEMRFSIARPSIGYHHYHYGNSWDLDGRGNSRFSTDKKSDMVNLLQQMGATDSDLLTLKKVQAQKLRKLCETEENVGDEKKTSRFEETTEKTAEFSVKTKKWGTLDVRVRMADNFGNTTFRYELIIPPPDNQSIESYDKMVVDANLRLCTGRATVVDHSTIR